MAERESIKQLIWETRLIVIARGMEPQRMLDAAEALYAGGVRLLECTFDHWREDCEQANCRLISALTERFSGRMRIGAGTVLTVREAEAAVDAGASFLISPGADEKVIVRTREMGTVSIPGALTPTEIVAAWQAGADFVKLFPVGALGPGYVKAVRAPLAHIPMLAVGGVTLENIPAFLKSGVSGFGIGGSILSGAATGDLNSITETARAYVQAVQGC